MKKWFVVEFSALTLEGDKVTRIGVAAYTYQEAIALASKKCPANCPWFCTDCTELKVYQFIPM